MDSSQSSTQVSHKGRWTFDPTNMVIGSWRIVRELGRTTVTRVFLAERADGQFDRQVVFRFLRASVDQLDIQRRFHREARVLGRLRHPGICQLLDSGVTEEGQPYFIAEYVSGESLYTYAREKKLNINQRLSLFLQICDAVSEAHRNLVVHHNLKASNVFIDSEGQAKLLDFGIARVQVGGDDEGSHPLPPATTMEDISALGTILSDLLADVAHIPESINKCLPDDRTGAFFVKPVNPPLPKDLTAILAKSLSREECYDSVEALSNELRRYLKGLPIKARSQSAGYLIVHYIQRYKALTAIGCLCLILLGSLFV